MPSKHHDDISPLVESWFPDLSPDQKRQVTEELTPFFEQLLDLFLDWRDGPAQTDSPESGNPDNLRFD